ncbi:hypothetical protein [Desulfatitalea alkaliphila]|uniref:Uncharacterized protein n=1 Tax=Desulfatitalea alkaliphila TaxID=2929485 RepID=A0AA41UMX2_9BACT|nr:hypothetical protein [Desulfatitalea alkaliphila]MCJ8498988.1 hypothetical protein [Desulfatitalea alkaliphila]
MRFNCMPEKISKAAIGIVFCLLGLGMVVLGLTILPYIGLFIAVPFFVLAFYFFRSHLTESCEIKTGS